VSWVLLSNDDGVDSPALLPFADAIERVLDLPVRVAVPATERSWSSKALTRHGTVRHEVVTRGGREIVAVDGTPADAVQLGLYGLFGREFAAAPPQALFTGINIGYNAGSAFLASSGTVWGAAEGAFAGLPTVAVSTGPSLGNFADWRAETALPAAAETWRRVAEVSADVLLDVSNSDLLDHCDLVSVNLPWDVTSASARRVTALTPMVYGPLFEPTGDDTWEFTSDLSIHVGDVEGHGDLEALRDGRVSITPVVLPRSAAVPDHTRRGLERS